MKKIKKSVVTISLILISFIGFTQYIYAACKGGTYIICVQDREQFWNDVAANCDGKIIGKVHVEEVYCPDL